MSEVELMGKARVMIREAVAIGYYPCWLGPAPIHVILHKSKKQYTLDLHLSERAAGIYPLDKEGRSAIQQTTQSYRLRGQYHKPMDTDETDGTGDTSAKLEEIKTKALTNVIRD